MNFEKTKENLFKKEVRFDEEILKMYEISGQNERAIKRYIKDKAQDEAIRNQIENSASFIERKIRSAPKEERAALRKIVLVKVKEGLRNPDLEVQKIFAGMIVEVPEEERAALVKEGLRNPDLEVQKIFAGMIGEVPEEEQKELFKIILEKGLGNELVKPPLYNKINIDKEKFSRQSFAKTGSETTLLGGELKDKAIVRHINPEAFLTWQKLYENYQWWKEAGFDYVPIEPILSYKLRKNGLIDVYSGVLDLSLHPWSGKSQLFMAELGEKKQKILNVLNKKNITHGHTHKNNFCLKFFRDADNNIDFSKAPRLYLIDFDAASS